MFCLLFFLLSLNVIFGFLPFLPTSSPLILALSSLSILPSLPNPDLHTPPPPFLASRLGSHVIGSPNLAATLVTSQDYPTGSLRGTAIFAHLSPGMISCPTACRHPSTLKQQQAAKLPLIKQVLPDLQHLHNVQTCFHCLQAFLSLDFHSRDEVSELKKTFWD